MPSLFFRFEHDHKQKVATVEWQQPMVGDQSEEGNGLASELGDGGKRDLLVLLLRDVLDDRLSPAILVSSGSGVSADLSQG